VEVESFVRAQELRALLEAGAIVQILDALEPLIAQSDADAANGDAIAEEHAASLRRRRDALVREHVALVSGSQRHGWVKRWG
jgi:hypothetical protein